MNTQSRQWMGAAGALALAAILGVPANAARTSEDMTVSGTARQPMEQAQTARRWAVTRSVVVAYGDLDLSSQPGAQTLYARLRGAARTVCGPREVRIQQLRRDWTQCVDTALDNAVAATGIERVVAIHREATGRDMSAASLLAGSP